MICKFKNCLFVCFNFAKQQDWPYPSFLLAGSRPYWCSTNLQLRNLLFWVLKSISPSREVIICVDAWDFFRVTFLRVLSPTHLFASQGGVAWYLPIVITSSIVYAASHFSHVVSFSSHFSMGLDSKRCNALLHIIFKTTIDKQTDKITKKQKNQNTNKGSKIHTNK